VIELKRIVALIVGLLCLALPATGAAATFTVNDPGDGPVTGTCATGETCTLRDALAAANATAEPENTVILPAGHYVLAEGELKLDGETTRIVGAGARSTVVDGGGASRDFYVSGGIGVFESLTVTGGAATEVGGEEFAGDGGGVLIAEGGSAGVFRGVAITGNTAMLNGGGIAAPPESATMEGKSVTVEGSTISGNKVSGGLVEALGGGVYVLGELTMVNSTVSGNAAESTVGLQEGGGILAGPEMTELATTSTAIVNSTIAGNAVGTGGTGGGLFILSPGGLIEPTSKLTNTIVSGNVAGEAAANCGSLTITSANDLSSDATCTFTDAASKREANPLLGPLANNGGETDTEALLPGSPAIDAGTAEGCPPFDQRGVARPLGTACDIGAYEFQPTPPTPPSKGGGNSGGGTTTGAASADLKLTIKPKPKKPKRGKKLAFTVTVANAGPSTAIGATFTATVPKATKKVKIAGQAANACKLVSTAKGKKAKKKAKRRTLICGLGDLATGKSLTFAIAVRTKKAPRKVVVSGAATSTVADPTPQDATAKAVVKLKG
jgi:uncharacterized repeat protein (TIGR01451 family)